MPHSAVMTTVERHLGDLIRARRRDLGLYTVVDAARRAGISRDTLAKVEAGESAKPATYMKLERALSWAPGSIDRVLAGEDPTPVEETPRSSKATPMTLEELLAENADLRAQVQEIPELRAEVRRLRAEVEQLRRDTA